MNLPLILLSAMFIQTDANIFLQPLNCYSLYSSCETIVQQPVHIFERFLKYYECPEPSPDNAVVTNSRCEDGLQKVNVTCAEGYALPDGETTRTLECGINREWIGLDNCSAIKCDAVMLENTDIDTLPPSDFETEITVTCENTFFLQTMETSYVTMCQANGQWSATFSCLPSCGDFDYAVGLKVGYKILGPFNALRESIIDKCQDEGAVLAYPVTQDVLDFYENWPAVTGRSVYVGLFRNPQTTMWLWANDTESGITDTDDIWCDDDPPLGWRLARIRPAGCLQRFNARNRRILCQKECVAATTEEEKRAE